MLERFVTETLDGCGIWQSKTLCTGIALGHAVGLFFDSEKVGTRMQSRHANEKRSSMAAEVDLQRRSRGLKPM